MSKMSVFLRPNEKLNDSLEKSSLKFICANIKYEFHEEMQNINPFLEIIKG